MNDEILKLARECGLLGQNDWLVQGSNIEAFYRAAFNAGVEHAKNGYPDAEGNHDIYIMGHYVGRGKALGTLMALPPDCWRKK